MTNSNTITPSLLKRKKFSKPILKLSKKKREIGILIHSAWKSYEKEVYNELINSNKIYIKVQDSERIMNQIRNKIIEKFNNSKYLQEISKFLHNIIQRIRRLIRDITFNSKFKIKEFIFQYFGGNPNFEVDLQFKVNGIEVRGRIDQLITTQDDYLIIKDLKPSLKLVEDINKNPSLFQVAIYAYLAEMSLSKKCKKIVLIDYNLQTQEVIYDFEIRAQILYEIKQLINNSNSDFLKKPLNYKNTNETKDLSNSNLKKRMLLSDDKKDEEELDFGRLNDKLNIGWCVARRSKKPNLSIQSSSKIKGYIEDTQKLRVIPGIYVIIEFIDSEGNVRIISKILSIKPFLDSISLIKNSMSENIIEVELEPLYEISEETSHFGQVRPHIFDKAAIRFCTDEEIIEFLNVPKHGFEIGVVEGYGDRDIIYKLPYQKLDESICILGTQGTGKTTLIYCMASKFGGDLKLDTENRPAIVILDIESEYRNLSTEEFKISNGGFIRNYEISREICVKNFKIGQNEGDYTLDLSLIEPEEYIYFIPDLTTKTSEAFIKIAKIIKEVLINENNFSKGNLLIGITQYIQTGKAQYLHPSTSQAIIRACDSKNFNLFDTPKCQKFTISELIKPGRVNIIDIFDLSDQEQRIISLYFMLVFYRSKMKSNFKNQNTLALIIDEAHRIFPRTSSITAEKEYIDRIISKVNEITHRGRKRHYGVIFATQSPKDLKKEIITTCNTKIFFRIAGEITLLREILEKHSINEIQNLPTGVGIISCQGVHRAIKVRFPHLKIKLN